MLESAPIELSVDIPGDARHRLSEAFRQMMRALFTEEGAQFRIDILAEPDAQDFINTHASILDEAMQRAPLSDIMRQRLQQSNWIFSGIKTFHELNEAFPALTDENGNRKPFERFLNDVRKVDDTYNRNYLRAEYNFVNASADMAARWEEFAQDGDHYNLQYRTACDEKVRPAHAALHGITLPPSHPFWQRYFPPNGWNCRCTVVQVRKSKYPETPDSEVEHLIEQNDTQNPKEAMFRFNPGMDQKTVPDYNAYTIRRCQDCDIAKGKVNLAANIPENELCAACKLVRECYTINGKQVQAWREELKNGGLPTQERHQPTGGVLSGLMLRSSKVLDRFLSHCYNVRELEAAQYIWQHPEELKEPKPSPFGEGKDPNNEKDLRNLTRKKKRGVIGYNLYRFSYKGKNWNVKVEVHKRGFEQFYAITK